MIEQMAILINMNTRNIVYLNGKMNFITIDFETAKYSQESACSIGLVKFQAGKVIDTYYSLIRPPSLYIRRDFTAIHGLTVNDVRDAPKFPEIWNSDIRNFIDGFPLAAHNASFDMGVLKAVLNWYELSVPSLSFFCTCSLARRTWTGLKSHSLSALAENFNIIYNAHNALDDALTCGKIALLAAEKHESSSVEELLSTAGVKMGIIE